MSGINRYDSPAQDRYQNTYVPLPYEQLMGTVVARQAQLDKEQDMLEKTYEDTQNIKYIPGSKDEQYVRDYLGKTGQLVDKYYGADLSDPIVKRQLRSEFSKMTNKQDIQNIQSSHAAWAQNQQYKAKLKAEGLYDPAIDEDPASGWDTRGSGVYNNITSPYKNPRPAAETYFNNIKASDLGTDKAGDYFYQGVTRDRINSVVDQKWNEFVNTSEGSLYVKKIARERGLDYSDQDVRRQIGTEYLKGVGEEFIYRDRAGATLEGQARASRKTTEDNSREPTTQQKNVTANKKNDPMGLGDMYFDEKDGIIAPSTGPAYAILTGTPNIPTTSGSKAKGVDTTYAPKQQEKLDYLRQTIPQFKNFSNKQVYEAYKDLAKSSSAMESQPYINPSPMALKGLSDQIYTTFGNRTMYLDDEFGKSDLTSSQDDSQYSALKQLGLTHDELKEEIRLFGEGKKSLVSVRGIDPGARKPGMIAYDVKDTKGENKGRSRTLLVDNPNDQFADIFKPTSELQQARDNFQEAVVPVGYDGSNPEIIRNDRRIVARVKPDVRKGENGKWKYGTKVEEGYLNEDDQFVYVKDGNLKDLMDAQIKILTSSKNGKRYLGSDIDVVSKTNPYAD